jgi:hypothetical protein
MVMICHEISVSQASAMFYNCGERCYQKDSVATFAEPRCNASLVRPKVGGVCEKHAKFRQVSG